MAIRISSLPPELQRRLLEALGPNPAPVVRRTRRQASRPAPFGKVCSCLCVIFRPDGKYPECCDGCGRKWPPAQA
jgi:hypothetical protein